MINIIENLESVRKKQAYGGLCLLFFCNHFNVTNEPLEILIRHLVTILEVEEITDWEEEFDDMELSGYNPLPENIKHDFPKEIQQDAENLIDSVATIAVVDMFGKLTERPVTFLTNAIDILCKYDVDLPSIKPFNDTGKDSGWGRRVSLQKYSELTNYYKNQFKMNVNLNRYFCAYWQKE